MSAFAAAQTEGLGRRQGLVDAASSDIAPEQRSARLKRCVGSPPRQTEDPLSPPCVAFFKGDNLGATAKGVTRDDVRVVLELSCAGALLSLQGSQRCTDPNHRKLIDCSAPVSADDTSIDASCKAYMRYFNERYQTYGRRIRLYASHDFPVADLEAQVDPFAVAGVFRRETLDYNILTIEHGGLRFRREYQERAPYLITFRPDIEDINAMRAGYVCSKLKDRVAAYAGEESYRSTTRKFAIWAGYRGLDVENLEESLTNRCGLSVRRVTGEDPANAPALKGEGITTVILVTRDSATHSVYTSQATNIAWFPEWIVPGSPGLFHMDSNFFGRSGNSAQWRNAFGITFDLRRDAIPDQAWYKAHVEACPECPRPSTTEAAQTGSRGVGAPQVYENLTLLFWGIQAAGPRLTVESLDKGLHAIPPRGSGSPYKPAAYFAPGNYTFIKDATMISWDPEGVPPGGSASGCYRLPREGQRFRANEWISGDADARSPGPCQGDTVAG